MELNKNIWTLNDYKEFINYLNTLQDSKYRSFHQRLLKKDINLIGIKTPILKKIAKSIFQGNYQSFLSLVTFTYYEETIIYGFIISNIKKLDSNLINYIDTYKTKIDNWASCDLFCSSLKIVRKNKDFFYKYIKQNLKSKNEYIKRMAFVLLLDYYIEPQYLEQIFKYSTKYNTKDYYVNMAVAWLISICYIKYKEKTYTYLRTQKLDTFTHNKAISKIIESCRIEKDEKDKLLNLKK